MTWPTKTWVSAYRADTQTTRTQDSVCFLAIGFGTTDGSAYAVMHINRAREEAGIPRLRINYPLRLMARKYRPMADIPDDDTLREDIAQYGYSNPGWRVRYFFNGAHSPLLREVSPEAFALEEASPSILLLRHDRIGELAHRLSLQNTGVSCCVLTGRTSR